MMKKPAAKADPKPKPQAKKLPSLREKAAAWRQLPEDGSEDHEGEEEEPKEKDFEVDDDDNGEEKRDYAKARKFTRMLESGGVPEDIKLLYEKGGGGNVGKRLFRSQLINRLFTKTKGRLVMCTDSPTWQNWVQQQDTVCTGPNQRHGQEHDLVGHLSRQF